MRRIEPENILKVNRIIRIALGFSGSDEIYYVAGVHLPATFIQLD
jgi:hypothetical protein